MVWENNTQVIVMITNVYEKHKKKCEQYWPNEGEAKYGKLLVTALNVEELAYWTVRRFTIKNTRVSKKVRPFHPISLYLVSLPLSYFLVSLFPSCFISIPSLMYIIL